ncbi:MAG: hypothetical protein NT081_10260 [Actinobacteria bacterium]|nr:hypothetical protein [Actinomycetota bacterium]
MTFATGDSLSLALAPELVEPFVAGLIGACDVEGGPTNEQFSVLQALVGQVWRRSDIDLRAQTPLAPQQLAAIVTSPIDRRHFQELIVTLEACRHPLTDAQLDRAEDYERAIGITGPDAALFRTMVDEGTERAKADFARFLVGNTSARVEPSLRDEATIDGAGEPELVARIEKLRSCAPGTLGHAYVEFYDIAGLPHDTCDFRNGHYGRSRSRAQRIPRGDGRRRGEPVGTSCLAHRSRSGVRRFKQGQSRAGDLGPARSGRTDGCRDRPRWRMQRRLLSNRPPRNRRSAIT